MIAGDIRKPPAEALSPTGENRRARQKATTSESSDVKKH
jgi:hypothetical protein